MEELKETVRIMNTEEQARALLTDYSKRLNDKANSLQWQNDAQITLFDILKSLGGYRIIIDKTGETKIFKNDASLMNDAGLLAIAHILSPVLNKDVVFSNLDGKQISRGLQEYSYAIIMNLYFNYDDYKISNRMLEQIKNQLLILIEDTFKRAHDARTLQHLETIYKILESSNKEERGRPSLFGMGTPQLQIQS